VLFNPRTIIDHATYDTPMKFSGGIERVYVNGKLSYTQGRGVVARSGRLVGGNK
jgi:N-acyl-D-amino-acid deacylase